MEIELVRRRMQTRIERKRTGPAEWLVITQRPLSDDRTLETQASRDACDQDTRYYYVLEHMFFHSPFLAICGSRAGKNEITFAQVHIAITSHQHRHPHPSSRSRP